MPFNNLERWSGKLKLHVDDILTFSPSLVWFSSFESQKLSKVCQNLAKIILLSNHAAIFNFLYSLTFFFLITDKVHSDGSVLHAYDQVKTILFFIGYSRSRHTLLGSLLDAHPHMIIADETSAFVRWRSNPHRWINSSIYEYYSTLLASSRRVVSNGRRSQVSEGSVSNATSNFRYYVPNQWQGNFDQYIEVSRIGENYFVPYAPARQKNRTILLYTDKISFS